MSLFRWEPKPKDIRQVALSMAIDAHTNAQMDISASLLIQEAEKIAHYIETGETHLLKDENDR